MPLFKIKQQTSLKRRANWKKRVAFMAAFILFSQPIFSQESPRLIQKTQAEAERAELKKKLSTLKRDISKTESAQEKAGDALEESEQAISVANRTLRDLRFEQLEAERRLRQLNNEQIELTEKVNAQKNQLSDFLKKQYMYGDSDRVKLLLSGDNPNRINRDLQYMSYISSTQAKMINGLKISLQEVEENQKEALETKLALDEIAQEEKENKAELEVEKKNRQVVLTKIADQLHKQKKEAANLRKDEQRLSALVNRLNKIMEEQARAAALAEKQRQERIAKEKADALKEKNRLAQQAQKSGKPTPTIEVEEKPQPAKSLGKVDQTPSIGFNDGIEFKRLKGQLYLPVRGEIIAKFGKQRGDGPTWKGIFIRAAEGAEIKSIAAGSVVFAEWMRGFGNMIIIDHGGQYLSLYSNNQAVLKHVGDKVKAGETIASAGNSGGNEETGVYFEMRYRGQVFDPMSWVRQ